MDVVTIIIGKESNLSKALERKSRDFICLSAREIILNRDILIPYRDLDIKIIFNNFQPSTELGDIDSYSDYIRRAILSTSIVLDFFSPQKIEKILYTSSSAVYGNNVLCSESDVLQPLSFHSSIKIANEKMIETYAKQHGVDYTMARIFNMYGGDDNFSIISKIIDAYQNRKTLPIVNSGSAIRDFIHIDNVVESYIKILSIKNIPIINIGTGGGNSVKNILKFLEENSINIKTKNIEREEITLSTSNNNLLKSKIGIDKFIEVESYLKDKLKL